MAYRKTFQGTIRSDQAAGVVGEVAYDSPRRVTPGLIAESGAPNAYIGRFYTLNPVTGLYQPGGTIGTTADDNIFGGIAVMPKEYVSFGDETSPLAPTMKLPIGQPASFMEMGHVWLYASDGAAQGMVLAYMVSTGVIGLLRRDQTTDLKAGVALIPNAVVSRVPFAGVEGDGTMFVAKLTN